MEQTKQYLEQHKERFLKELFELISIPSVGSDPAYYKSTMQTAEKTAELLKKAGVDNVECIATSGFPVVYGEKIINSKLPTILVYGHYDVQPADPIELWDSPPFEPEIRDGKIYGRGSCDDKGQFFMHFKAIEAMIATKTLPCNVKVMIEGEEEVGSESLPEFLEKYKEKLCADVILISDTSIIANDIPSITTGLRGISYAQVELTGPNRDLHSGTYGGGVANPVNILCKMIASLHDENNHITIPGFYDDVIELSKEERIDLAKAPFDLNEYKKDLNIDDVYGEAGYSTLERTSVRPTLDVNGIWGGYIGEGAKTVLPSKAYAKISMRLVPNQTNKKNIKLFSDHIKKIAPPSVKVKVIEMHGGNPFVTGTNSAGYQAAKKAISDTFGKEAIPTREGGSIPIVELFQKLLGLESILMGFGLDTDLIHSPNEHYGLFNFYKGIETIPLFYKYYAELK